MMYRCTRYLILNETVLKRVKIQPLCLMSFAIANDG